MANPLGAKPSIDTSEFKSGIATMNRELRVLESGFRASAASLGDWGKDATGLESRIKTLSSALDIQRQKVALTRAEYERVKAEKGENSRAAQELEIKLNKENETLGKMERELRETEGALEELRDETSDTTDATDELIEKTEEADETESNFRRTLAEVRDTAAGLAAALLTGLVIALAAVVTAVSGAVFSSAKWADDLTDLSLKTGISTERLQELEFIANNVGTSLDTITASQGRLIRSMAGAQDGTGDQAKAFERLGISVTDANGQLRDSQSVFNEVIDALGRVSNETERDALAMKLFGKSALELNPLIKAGSEEMARLTKEARDMGAVVSGEDVAALTAFNDMVEGFQAGLKGTLGTLAAEFLPIFQEVAGVLQDFFKSEEFKTGIKEFGNSIAAFVTLAVDVFRKLASGDLQGALAQLFGADKASSILNFLDSLRSFINGTLIPFVTEHAEEIKAALIGIGAALGAAGIVAVIASIVAAINPVTLIIAALVAVVGLLAAAWEGNWGGMRDTVALWWSNMKSVLVPLWEWLSTSIPAALQTLSGFWTGTLLPAIQAVWEFLNGSIFPLFRAIGEFLSAVFGVALRALAGIWQNVLLPPLQVIYGYFQEKILPILRTVGDYVKQTLQPIFDKFGSFMSDKLAPAFLGISEAIASVITWLTTMAETLNTLQLPEWMTPGSPTPWEIGLVGINQAMSDLTRQLPTLAKQLDQSFAGAAAPGLSGSAAGSSTQNDSFQFFAPVVIQGTTPGSLGASLKGKRF